MTDWTEQPFYNTAHEADTLLDHVADVLRRRFPLSLAQTDLLLADLRNDIEARLDTIVDQVIEEAKTSDDDDN